MNKPEIDLGFTGTLFEILKFSMILGFSIVSIVIFHGVMMNTGGVMHYISLSMLVATVVGLFSYIYNKALEARVQK